MRCKPRQADVRVHFDDDEFDDDDLFDTLEVLPAYTSSQTDDEQV